MSPSLTDLAAPLLLFAMMLVVGLELTPADFRRVMALPRAVVVGTLGQLTLLPALTLVVLAVLDLPAPIAGGVVLILAAPGGGISNVFTLISGANLALSVTLTALASLLAVVTLPLILSAGLAQVGGEASALSVPVLPLIGQLVVVVLVPIGLGMWLRLRGAGWALRRAVLLRRLVLVGVAAMIAFGLSSDSTGMLASALDALWLALAWTIFAMLLGYGLGRLASLEAADCFTLAIEFGVKNVGLAAIVAIASMNRPNLLLFAAAYIATGYPLAAILSVVFRRLSSRPRP